MAERIWQVVIADLKSSRDLGNRERIRIDQALRRAIPSVLRRYKKQFRLAPQVLRGDEMQAVLIREAPALTILTYLRARLVSAAGRKIEMRAGIGRGAIARLSSKGPFTSDGQAFHRARGALDRVREDRGTRRTGWVTGDRLFDVTARATLGLMDAFVSRWTVPQWEAVAGRIEDKGLHEIAAEERVAFQSVSKRLRAASWNEVQEAIDLLELRALTAVDEPRGITRPAKGESPVSPSRG